MNNLPKFIQDEISTFPEYTNGVNRVTVELADGTQYKEVYVAWAEEVVRVGEGGSISFDTRQVVKAINCP